MPGVGQLFTLPSTSGLPTDPHLLMGDADLAKTLYGEIGQQAGEKGEVEALGIEAQGKLAEAGQYGTAADIAAGNATLAQVGGDIQKYMAMRQVTKTIGTQQATGAAMGFANAGSALDLARSSMQQGLLQTQLLGTNAELEAGGYLEQAAASRAEATTATSAADYITSQQKAAQAQLDITGKTIDTSKALMSGLPGGPAILSAVATGDAGSLGIGGGVIGADGMIDPAAVQAKIAAGMTMQTGTTAATNPFLAAGV